MSIEATATPHPSRSSTAKRRAVRLVGPIGRAMAGHRWFKLYGILVHRGRTSGREYRIPIVARPFDGGFVIPMPFGESTQWARNVLAAGGATIVWNGRPYHVTSPEIIDAEAAGPTLSAFQKAAIGRVGIAEFMRVRVAPVDR